MLISKIYVQFSSKQEKYVGYPMNRHYQHTICTALILVKEGEYPELRIKAYASRVLLGFLQQKVAQLVNQQHASNAAVPEPLLMVHGALKEMSQWFKLIESAQRYLSTTEAEEIWAVSMRFLVFNLYI